MYIIFLVQKMCCEWIHYREHDNCNTVKVKQSLNVNEMHFFLRRDLPYHLNTNRLQLDIIFADISPNPGLFEQQLGNFHELEYIIF